MKNAASELKTTKSLIKIFTLNFYIFINNNKKMAKFEISKDKREEFRFNLKAGNGQTILASEGYKAKTSCLNGIESVKKNSQEDKRFDRLESKNGKHYFNLKATNGQIIGSSEMYNSVSAMENGIASVRKNAPIADTVE